MLPKYDYMFKDDDKASLNISDNTISAKNNIGTNENRLKVNRKNVSNQNIIKDLESFQKRLNCDLETLETNRKLTPKVEDFLNIGNSSSCNHNKSQIVSPPRFPMSNNNQGDIKFSKRQRYNGLYKFLEEHTHTNTDNFDNTSQSIDTVRRFVEDSPK